MGQNNPTVHLDIAAFEIARVEFPKLEVAPLLDILDSHASELGDITSSCENGEERVLLANEYLFEELGFKGNEVDYYSPLNSCLNEVLTSRVGIPVTLSVVYLEIARRLGWPVQGISMPGHCIVQYDDGEFNCFVDPYHGGRIMDLDDCRRLAFQIAQVDIKEQPDVMDPATTWQLALRMLHNLRSIYARRKEYGKLARVLDWILIAVPDSRPDRELREQIRQYMRLLN